MVFLDFLDFLELDKSTLRKNSNKENNNETNSDTQEQTIECEEQNYQLIENTEIIEKDHQIIEMKILTEIVPLGNKKAMKRTKIIEQQILRR